MKRRSSGQEAGTSKKAKGDSSLPLPDLAEYKEGSIVRVTLKNFVTYTNATFYPGPRLNVRKKPFTLTHRS